ARAPRSCTFRAAMAHLSTLAIWACCACTLPALAQPLKHGAGRTHADTLRGSNGPYRAWWDVTHYEVSVTPDIPGKRIAGSTVIRFRATADGQRMQVD